MVYNKENLKIYIVDDNEIDLELLEAMLIKMGFQKIIKSKSSEEAIRLIKEDPPDLFFIDIIMPGMDGNEFRELLKENPATKDIPVVFISGIISKTEEKAMGGKLVSGDIIVAKPFSKERITEAVTESLKKKIRYIEKQYGRRRLGRDRRQFSYDIHVLERRSGKERRIGKPVETNHKRHAGKNSLDLPGSFNL